MSVDEQSVSAIGRALALQQRGDLAGARSLLEGVLARSPDHADALHFLGLVLHAQGELAPAIERLERAVALAPGNLDAWNNLGGVVAPIDPARAEACFRRVLEAAPNAAATRANLALVLEKLGRLDEAQGQAGAVVRMAPDDPDALAMLARLSRAIGDHAASVAAGERLYALRPSEKLKRAVSRSYFLWFDQVDRDLEVAKKVVAAWRAFDPSDPIAEHMLAALSHEHVPARASDAYVARHFDEFAPTFDQTLRALGYRGPEHAAAALSLAVPQPKGELDVVDLGCGTGLLGPLVRPFARRLVGVDLAAKMLERAAEQGSYDELVAQEVTTFLEGHPRGFDVAACLDTLVYVGDVEPVIRALAGSLRPGGLFIFTVERLVDPPPSATYVLHAAGRYAHAEPYVVKTLEAYGFVIERLEPIVVRIEYGEPVPGLVVTARLGAGAGRAQP